MHKDITLLRDILRQIIYISIVDSMFRIANMIEQIPKTNEIFSHPKYRCGSSTTIYFHNSFKIDD